MNMKLLYLYRDAGNYKNYGEVVFGNDAGLTLPEMEKTLRACMIDGGWFVADQWGLPDLHFKEFDWDSELDHEWHEFAGLEEVHEASNAGDIEFFLVRIQKMADGFKF